MKTTKILSSREMGGFQGVRVYNREGGVQRTLAPAPLLSRPSARSASNNATVRDLITNRGNSIPGLVLNAGISPGLSQSAAINYTLTDFATGHMNDLAKTMELAERLCPTVHVPGAVGRYKKFDDINSFQAYDTKRGIGSDPTRIQFAAEDEYYHCSPQALEVTVDEEERNLTGTENAEAQQLLDEGKIKSLLNVAGLSFTKTRVDYVLANTTAVANRGNFSNPNIDPIDQIDEQLDNISKVVGSTENLKITMDVSAWRAIRSNALAKRRLVGVQLAEISQAQFKDMLLFPCDVGVYSISYVGAPGTGPAGGGSTTTNTPSAGEFSTKLRLLSGVVLIHFSAPNPTQYDCSAFKSFTIAPGNPQTVRSYMAPNGLYGGHIVSWSEDVEQTSTIAMVRLNLS